MLWFKKKTTEVDEELLQNKYLNKTKEDFKKWLQNTYEALNYEQLESVSKFAKEIYNIDDDQYACIIATRPSKYFPVRTTTIPPPPRGKRRELNLYDDACLMDKKDLDEVISKNNRYGLSKKEILLKLGNTELLDYYNKIQVDFCVLCYGINIGLSVEDMKKVFNDITNSGDCSFSFAMRCLDYYYMKKHTRYNDSKEWYEPEVTKLHFKNIQASNSNYKAYTEFVAPVSKNFDSEESALLVQIYTQGNFPYRKAGTWIVATKVNY